MAIWGEADFVTELYMLGGREECGRVEAGESLRGQKLGTEKTNKSKSPVI